VPNFLNLYRTCMIVMPATKRIPVSEETWKELGKKKEPGQTWDDLLEQLHIKAMKNQVASKTRRAKDGDLETASLDDV